MSKPSALAKQFQQAVNNIKAEYEDIRFYDYCFVRQLFADLSQIALEEAFGDEAVNMVEPFVNALSSLNDQFCDIWNADSMDVEYSLETIDRRLKKLCGDKFMSSTERYKGIKFKGKDLKLNDISESA